MPTFRGKLAPGECVKIEGVRICNRWQKNTAGATEDYKKGIANPKRSWGRETCLACDRYSSGVDKAYGRNAFGKGVKKAGTNRWRAKTLLKGPTRFFQGVIDGSNSYADGYKPYHASFPGISLGPRFRRGDPRNIGRCNAVCTAFGKIKVGAGKDGVTCPDR
jgi:hypothetical protein